MKTKLLTLCLLIPLFGMSQFQLIKDINPGSSSSDPDSFFQFNGNFYFSAKDNGPNLIFLSDGSTSGTNNLTFSNNPLTSPFNQTSVEWLEFNNELYFSAFDGNFSFDIFKNDGTNSGNIRVTNSGGMLFDASFADTPIYDIIEYNSEIYFSGDDTTVGDELQKVDNSTNGYSTVKEITIGTGVNDTNPRESVVINNKIIFAGTFVTQVVANATGREIYISDGTDAGTQIILDINPGPASSDPRDFTVFNNKLYFTADDGNGRELWTTDGTTAGTYKVDDLNGSSGSDPTELTVYNNQLVFSIVATGAFGREPAKMNTAENISTLGNINPSGADSNPAGFYEHNGLLYFAATGPNGRELYSTNGNQTSTGLVTDINMSGDSNPEHLVSYGGLLFFAAEDASGDVELWSYDDSTMISSSTQDLNTSGSSNPIPRFVYNNQLILTADDGTVGNELWSYTLPQFLTFVPDDDFEQLLINQGFDTVSDDYVLTSNISGITNLNLNGSSGFTITDFTGLEDFASLENLNLAFHDMIVLDVTPLSTLKSLIVGQNPNLSTLIINASDNSNLEQLQIALNNLTNIQIDGFLQLNDITIAGESNLQSLGITNCTNPNLEINIFQNNNVNSLSFSNSNPRTLILEDITGISSIDLSSLTNLVLFSSVNNGFTELDLTQNSALTNVIATNSNNDALTTLNVKNGNNSAITNFNATDNSNLSCIEVDDETAANAGTGAYALWNKDVGAVYSENCASLSIDDFFRDELTLYPNPVKDSFSLRGKNVIPISLSVYDINGRLVKSFADTEQNYSLRDLVTGVYFIKVQTENGFQNFKIIKE